MEEINEIKDQIKALTKKLKVIEQSQSRPLGDSNKDELSKKYAWPGNNENLKELFSEYPFKDARPQFSDGRVQPVCQSNLMQNVSAFGGDTFNWKRTETDFESYKMNLKNKILELLE